MLIIISSLAALAIFTLVIEIIPSQERVASSRFRNSWYDRLEKPSYTPPPRLFSIVWPILYGLMGLAAWLVWQSGPGKRQVHRAEMLFAVQLALNLLWSPVFFILKAPGLALALLAGLWVTLCATINQFYRARPIAGLLMMPYLLWVSFAAILNEEIWRRNRNGAGLKR